MYRIALLTLLPALIGAAQGAAIHMDGGVFRVSGWQTGSQFSVYAGTGDVPPLLGTSSVEAGILTFRPRFSLSPGMHVRAVFQPPTGDKVEAEFDIPKAAPLAATTRVGHVYPSTDILPAN